MADTAHHTGKQVFLGDTPVADAYSEETAARIVAALNAPGMIAASLDAMAAKANLSLKRIPEDSVLWGQTRNYARAYRIAADHVRAGLWEETDNG